MVICLFVGHITIKSMGTQIVRVRNGKEYLYYAYYDDGKRLEMYCGLAGKTESKKKAYKYEVEELTKQKIAITKKITTLNKKIHGES